MSFTYNNAVPAAPNNPSNDQPDMLTNAQSIASIWSVDHIGFNASNGGTHLQTTFISKNTPAAQTDPSSTLFTASGTASTVAQLKYRNQNGTFQISPIAAWAFCDSTGAIQGGQSVNVVSVVHNSTGNYTVTLTSNAVTGSNFAVFLSSGLSTGGTNNIISNYTITGAGTFTIEFVNTGAFFKDPVSFSFQVLQI